jgi:REP element-mobilizing transposase RayT
MSHQARGHIEAGLYHVTTRSAGPIPMFTDDIDRTDFCNRLARCVTKVDWTLRAFCVMTTHYHLLVEVEENGLQPGMQWLNGTYAQQFNRRHARWGHLTGRRYSHTPIESKRQFCRCFRYIALNPVKGDVCERPQDWYWSSYAGLAGYRRGFPFVDDSSIRALFGPGPTGTELLRAFVEEAVTEP